MYEITVVNHPAGAVRVIENVAGGERIQQRAVVGCDRCLTDAYVPHYTCMYAGNAMGHSEGHCTANACY